MPDDRFEVGQLVKHMAKSASRRRPGAEYGMVVGVRGNAVDTVHVLKRLPGTRFWDETDNPSAPARDNVLLRDCDGVPTPEEGLEAMEAVGQRRQRQSWASKLEESERQKARLRAGPERGQAVPAAEEPSLKSRLAALEVARKAPGTGHGGLGE